MFEFEVACLFAALCLPHTTNKIQAFEDLESVRTLGFRGEAISALCCLSHVEIITRHSQAAVAHCLQFGSDGALLSKNACSRQIGTTVRARTLFDLLPVRRKQLLQSAKSELIKIVDIVTSYALISPSVRFLCTNTCNNKKSVLLRTSTDTSMANRIGAIWGSEQLKSLMSIKRFDNVSAEMLQEMGVTEVDFNQFAANFVLSGWISSSQPGKGRSSNDRQMVYICHRPCNMPALCQIARQTYHLFNKPQQPVFILNVDCPEGYVDLNLTPDKRTVMLRHEQVLLALLRASLFDSLSSDASCIPVNSFSKTAPLSSLSEESFENTIAKAKRIGSGGEATQSSGVKQLKLNESFKSTGVGKQTAGSGNAAVENDDRNSCLASSLIADNDTVQDSLIASRLANAPAVDSGLPQPRRAEDDDIMFIDDEFPDPASQQFVLSNEYLMPKEDGDPVRERERERQGQDPSLFYEDVVLESGEKIRRLTKMIDFSLDRWKEWYEQYRQQQDKKECEKSSQFKAKILHEENQIAEAELKRKLHRDDFAKMEVIGQFNRGFIVTRLGDDLFIVDQHAADEKYLFEQMEQNATISSQPLIKPVLLNLSSAQRVVLRENLDIFKRNGFDFEIVADSSEEEEKVFLKTLPYNQNWTSDKADIEELLAMLADSPNVMCRPSRLRSLFASRACRKAVMVGDALNKPQMSRIVQHMSEMRQPWNCPHGRPTFRHLCDLSSIDSSAQPSKYF